MVGTRDIVCCEAKLDILHECGNQLEKLFQVYCEPSISVAGEHPRRVFSMACKHLQVLALAFLDIGAEKMRLLKVYS